MGIFLNGNNNPTRVIFNGNSNINRVIFRHNNADTIVWQKEIIVSGPPNPYFNGYTGLWYGSGFSSDTTDYYLSFSSDLSSNPLTLDDVELNSTNITSVTWLGSIDIEHDDGYDGTTETTVNYSDILPSMDVITQGLNTPCPSGFHMVKAPGLALVYWLNLNGAMPPVLNTQVYNINLADSYGHGPIYIGSADSTGYTNYEGGTIADVNNSERPIYSSFCWIAPTGTVESYVNAYIARRGWTGARYSISNPSAKVTTDTSAFRLKFHDSNNAVWYSDWIAGLGFGFASFAIRPA